jgi:hypothetical protein
LTIRESAYEESIDRFLLARIEKLLLKDSIDAASSTLAVSTKMPREEGVENAYLFDASESIPAKDFFPLLVKLELIAPVPT